MSNRFQVTEEEAGERLDRIITAHSDRTRSSLQRDIKNGLVTVNGEQVSKHFAVSAGDEIVIVDGEEVAEEKVAQEVPVLYEDEQIVVVEKPMGVLVHPAEHTNEWTLVDFLLERSPDSATVGEDATRPGIVHRLDRDVSGVMVLTKTQEAFESLKQQFHDRTVQKEYWAVVHGVPDQDYGVIKFKIARSKTHPGRMAARPEHEEGKAAWTSFEIEKRFHERYCGMRIQIRTGRTHQIRAHLSAIDHPIVGDSLYITKHYKNSRDYGRLFLHSVRLGITHPASGEEMEFRSEVPEVFTTFFENN